jgi:uncharacterized membrane protein YcjF (UPF0283 family)
MLSNLVDTSTWSHEQWLAAIILAFVVITVLVVLKRLVGLFKLSKKEQYKPNLRPLRRTSQRRPK